KITEGKITLKVDGKSVDTPLPEVLNLSLRPTRGISAAKYLEVELLDGSKLRCTKIHFTAKEAQLQLTTGLNIKVPLPGLVTVLRDAEDEEIRKQWDGLMKQKLRGDHIFILKDGQLNPVPGVIGDIDEKQQTVKFKGDKADKEIEPLLEKLQGMQFARV